MPQPPLLGAGLHCHLGVLVNLLSPLAPQFGQSKRIGFHLIVESRYVRDYIPKFQTKFHVPEEEPDGPFQGLFQRDSYRFGHHIVGLQDPKTDRAHPEGTPLLF